MIMEYEVMPTEKSTEWIIRVYGNNQLCGKLRLDTATKDSVTAKFDELGWTERT